MPPIAASPSAPPRRVDILIVGGGMAGMSLAAEIAGNGRVLLLAQEEAPGYHATGRSVAFWEESYGGPLVQPLTSASGPLMARYLGPRRAVHVGREEDAARARALQDAFAGSGVPIEPLAAAALREMVPGLLPEWTHGLHEPSCRDIDAAGMLADYAARARRGGVEVRCGARFLSARREGGDWLVETGVEVVRAGILVNAAGAWADAVAAEAGVAPIGIAPLRRTVVQLRCRKARADLPLVMDLGGRFYFKPSGEGRVWLSPHDEAPDSARDVAPEELDVATAIDRFQGVVDWPIEAVERRWAGLRSFAPDRLPVYGFDARVPGFFWFAGQGGFGIQTAPAAALIGAALLTGAALPGAVSGIDAERYAARRFALAGAGAVA